MSFVAQSSKSKEDLTPKSEIAQTFPSKGINSQLMRLRGGASDSKLKKRKRQPSPSSSGRKKAKVNNTSSSDAHSSSRDNPPSIKPLPLIAGFIAENKESKSHFTGLRMGHRPRSTASASDRNKILRYLLGLIRHRLLGIYSLRYINWVFRV